MVEGAPQSHKIDFFLPPTITSQRSGRKTQKGSGKKLTSRHLDTEASCKVGRVWEAGPAVLERGAGLLFSFVSYLRQKDDRECTVASVVDQHQV